jgi:hypothetical protein
VILLSNRELEPYHVYERTAQEFDIRGTAISLRDLALATLRVFFEPKRKATAAEATAPGLAHGERQAMAPSTQAADTAKNDDSAHPALETGQT